MIHFNTQFTDKVAACFVEESLAAGRLSGDYDFSGAKTVMVMTPLTVPMRDYDREAGGNRYGTPAEMQDTVQELTLLQDKSFALTVDRGNDSDQAFLKKAGKMLLLQVSERAIPEMDTYIFSRLAQKAGNVVGGPALTKSTLCAALSEATRVLDDAEVPQNDRTLFVSSETYAALKHSDEFMKVEGLAREAVRRGVVGRYDNMEIVKVPKKRWPAHVQFIAVHKNAATAPVKLSETHLHNNPPGLSGSLLEGRQYYDLFVFAPRCEGVYVYVDTTPGRGTVCAAPAISAAGGMTSATAGARIAYTTDGTDPRYSPTAKTGSASDVTLAGTAISAYAFQEGEGIYPSKVTRMVLS